MNFGNFALLRFFIDVIDEGSISGAARTHNISIPAASRKMRQLEHLFGVRLLQRTTRRQSLTEEGVILYEQAVRILGDLETLEDMLRQNSREVAGVLRVTAPVSLGRRRIAPLLAQFGAMYPRLSVHLKLTDTVLDLVASGMDVAIRYGATEDSSYYFQTAGQQLSYPLRFTRLCANSWRSRNTSRPYQASMSPFWHRVIR
ncbi:LysR family transcriptional regulator (plasmid) [Klebsiella pneumoniae]|uniref:LysR family transcriptional regulator n=1 Tax=Klebsiella pneumoniae TaxID=573 RepID=UPI0028BE3305|nr:LysR family transcriptional regulator [Klebsiella pneumoniae]